jgi:hypothetical protein
MTDLSNTGRNASGNASGHQSDAVVSDGGEIANNVDGSSTSLEKFSKLPTTAERLAGTSSTQANIDEVDTNCEYTKIRYAFDRNDRIDALSFGQKAATQINDVVGWNLINTDSKVYVDLTYCTKNSEPSPGLLQVIAPVSTSALSKHPIGGSEVQQQDYGKIVNTNREIAYKIMLGGIGSPHANFAINQAIKQTLKLINNKLE